MVDSAVQTIDMFLRFGPLYFLLFAEKSTNFSRKLSPSMCSYIQNIDLFVICVEEVQMHWRQSFEKSGKVIFTAGL